MPVNNAGYAQQASDLQYRYNTDRAANSYGRFLSQQRGERSVGDLSRDFNRALPNYKARFGQRGLMGGGVRSGIMQRSMKNYLGDYTTNYMRTQQDAQQGVQQYDRANTELDAWYQKSLADLEMEKQQEIANAAAAMEALRPLLGGL